MTKDVRITEKTFKVLEVFVKNSRSDRYGLEMCGLTRLSYDKVQPILRRLEQAGWLEASWEDIDPQQAKRRARRYYRLTNEGCLRARAEVDRIEKPSRQRLVPAFGN